MLRFVITSNTDKSISVRANAEGIEHAGVVREVIGPIEKGLRSADHLLV